MRSQLRFVMHPSDELDFAGELLSEIEVRLVDGPRWKTSIPSTHRSIKAVTGSYCIIWSAQDRPVLSARYVPTCEDWYCDSESVTIQFLRSQTFGSVITEGRLAISTADATAGEAAAVERRYRSLSRFLKKRYMNSTIHWYNPTLAVGPAVMGRSANPSKPDAQVWVGPQAMRWLQQDPGRRIKQFTNATVEAKLVETVA